MNNKNKSTCINVSFSSDSYLLKGVLHLPRTEFYPPVIIGSHGLLSNSNSPKQIELAEKCNKNGIAYFRFDHRGCGQSEGEFNTTKHFDDRCTDFINAVHIIMARSDTGNQIGLFGSSMGGAICIATSDVLHPCAIVTFAAPLKSESIILAAEQSEIEMDLLLQLKKYLRFDLSNRLSDLRNILIFHGDADNVVPVSNARKLFEAAGLKKHLVVQKKGDHKMSDKKYQEEFIHKTVNWFKKYFELPTNECQSLPPR